MRRLLIPDKINKGFIIIKEKNGHDKIVEFATENKNQKNKILTKKYR